MEAKQCLIRTSWGKKILYFLFILLLFIFSSQVDFVIKEATNLDNLAQLYEGWTAWVWRTACASSLWSSTGLEINQLPEGQWRWTDATQPIRGLETGAAADSALPKLLGSQKGAVVDLVALLQPHSPTICYWAKQRYAGAVTPPSLPGVQPGKAMLKSGRWVRPWRLLPPRQHLLLLGLLWGTTQSSEASQLLPRELCCRMVCPPPPPRPYKESTQQTSRSVDGALFNSSAVL